ncbi:MAG: protein kinase [Deltaproteobacteria bacterium]|nr:protein kinase [Deltaproteobacteria bacterium]
MLRSLGPFELHRRIGVGGTAEVYEATWRAEGGATKQVAVKLLLPDLQKDRQLVEMFIDEARIAARLSHPNVVAVYEFGQVDGTLYIAMEHVQGWDLRELLQRAGERKVLWPIPAALYVVQELLRGLDYVHKQPGPIVHRDVTPHNVFITRTGEVKLGDFGIAKAAERLARTAQGQIKGKLAYLAPEQVTGDPVTPRTDVYAAGLILFELLAGRRLLEGEREVQLINAAMHPPLVELARLRPEATPLEGIVRRALQPHPTLRYPDAGTFANELLAQLGATPFGAAELSAWAATLEGGAGALERTITDQKTWIREPVERARAQGTRPLGSASGAARPAKEVHATEAQVAEARVAAEVPDSTDPSLPAISFSGARPRRWAVLGIFAALVLLAGGVGVWFWRGAASSGESPSRDASVPDARSSRADARSSRADAPSSPVDARSQRADAEPPVVPERLPTVVQPRSASRRRRASKQRGGEPAPVRVTPVPSPVERDPAREPKPGPPAADPVALAAERQQLEALQAGARARGLFPGDDARFDRRLAEARRALSARELGRAQGARAEAQAVLAAFRLDRAFAERKLARLEGAIARARLTTERRQELERQSQRILRLILEGQLAEASALISRALSRL